MIKTRTLYVMASRTGTGVGRMIRAVSHYDYNHISLTLDPTLQTWYAFARYRQDSPLYSGLVTETLARFCAEGTDVQVRIFQVEIPESKARELEALLPLADDPASGLIYNHFDILARSVGLRVPIPGCHTCLSFACEILDADYMTIQALCRDLQDRQIYEGSLAQLLGQPGHREGIYFTPLGLLRGSCLSALQLGKLAHRTVAEGIRIYMAYDSRRTVQ